MGVPSTEVPRLPDEDGRPQEASRHYPSTPDAKPPVHGGCSAHPQAGILPTRCMLQEVAVITPGNICDGCTLQFALDKTNTIIHYFDCQPWFSFGAVICPQCCQTARLFWRENFQDYLDYFILQDFPFEAAEYADDLTVQSFEQVYGLKPETEHELTARMELELQNLHVVLENIPDDLLLDMMETPEAPHDLPERWI